MKKLTLSSNLTVILCLICLIVGVADGQEIDPISVGNGPQGLAITPNGNYVYVTNRYDDTVSIIRTSDNTVLPNSISVGDSPNGVVTTPNGSYVYVTNWGDNTVSVIRTSDNTMIDTIPVGNNPLGVAVTPNGSHVYVVNRNSFTVSIIQTSDNTVIDNISVNATGYSHIAITPNGSYAYVTYTPTNRVTVIRTSDNTVIDTIFVGNNPDGVAIAPNGNYVYVTNRNDGTVSVIRTSDNTVVDTLSVGYTGNQISGIAITPNGSSAYVANKGVDTVSVIRTSDNTVLPDPISVGDGPQELVITPNGSFVYVANNYDDTVSVISVSENPEVECDTNFGNASCFPPPFGPDNSGVCMVIAHFSNGFGIGTGFLVAPDMILTAWHGFEHEDNELSREYVIKNSWCEFNYDYTACGNIFNTTTPNIVGFEKAIKEGDAIDKDYALIKLKSPVPSEWGCKIYSFYKSDPNINDKISCAGYPRTYSQVPNQPEQGYFFSKDYACGNVINSSIFLNNNYFSHDLNTGDKEEGGTSGAPIFDKNFNVVGIHQGIHNFSEKAVALKVSAFINDINPYLKPFPIGGVINLLIDSN